MLSSKLAPLAAITCIFLGVIPVVRSAEIDVTVGGTGILQFTPNNVVCFPISSASTHTTPDGFDQNASVGDVVRFTFQQKNHTATQSTLASPCSAKEGGFDSGLCVSFPSALL